MGMTLQLTDAQAQVLRALAETEGRSAEEVARDAVDAYVRFGGRQSLDGVFEAELPRFAAALLALAEQEPGEHREVDPDTMSRWVESARRRAVLDGLFDEVSTEDAELLRRLAQ